MNRTRGEPHAGSVEPVALREAFMNGLSWMLANPGSKPSEWREAADTFAAPPQAGAKEPPSPTPALTEESRVQLRFTTHYAGGPKILQWRFHPLDPWVDVPTEYEI